MYDESKEDIGTQHHESQEDIGTQHLAEFCLEKMVTAHKTNMKKSKNYRDFFENQGSGHETESNSDTYKRRKENARLMQHLCFWWWLREPNEANKKLLAWLVFRPDILNDYKPFHLTKDEQEEKTYTHHPDNPYFIIWKFLKDGKFEVNLSNNDCNDQLFAQIFAIIATQNQKDINFKIEVEQPKLKLEVEGGTITRQPKKNDEKLEGWSDKIIYAIGKTADFFRWIYNSIKYFKTKKSLKKTKKLLERDENGKNKTISKINQEANAATEILKEIKTSKDFDINNLKEDIKTLAGSKWFIFNIRRIKKTVKDLQSKQEEYVNNFDIAFEEFENSSGQITSSILEEKHIPETDKPPKDSVYSSPQEEKNGIYSSTSSSAPS